MAKEDTSEYANLLMTYFNENEDFLSYVELSEGEEPVLQKALERGTLDAYLVIPENFAQSMIQMENLPIKARISMKNPTKALILRHAMEAYKTYIEAVEVNCTALYRRMREENFTQKELDAANFDISMDLIFTALGKDAFFKRQTVEQEVSETLPLTEHYQYTLVYFVLLFSFIPAGLQVISLKKNGMKDRLRVVNVSTGSMFAAIGIPYFVFSVFTVWAVLVAKGSPERLFSALLFVVPWILVFLLSGLLCVRIQAACKGRRRCAE